MYQLGISTTQVFNNVQVEKVGNPKNVKTLKEASDGNETECHEIEPNPSKD
jgi:hypothetical protein